MSFLPPAPTLAATAATRILVPVMPGEDFLQMLRKREDRSWPALAEGKLPRLLKWLADYQARQKTAVSSTVACLAAVATTGSAGHGARQLALHNTPLLHLRDLDKASETP